MKLSLNQAFNRNWPDNKYFNLNKEAFDLINTNRECGEKRALMGLNRKTEDMNS